MEIGKEKVKDNEREILNHNDELRKKSTPFLSSSNGQIRDYIERKKICRAL